MTIKGVIDEYGHAFVQIEVGGRKSSLTTLALLDSGFDGELCLPIEIALPLGLELAAVQTVEFADGSTKKELLFDGRLRWEGKFRRVEISLTEAQQAMLGTALLLDRCLTIDFRSGEVRIEQ